MTMANRYARQIALSEIGKSGQERLEASSVVIIGCGALGSVAADNLTRIGVGKIKMLDRDIVELENLGRQVLFNEDDVKERLPKAKAAQDHLRKINSEISIEGITEDVDQDNIEDIIDGFDLVLDDTDNMETRFLINDACVKKGIPWIYAGAVETQGMTMTVVPGITACLNCFIEETPPSGALPTCHQAGIINTTTNIIASIQTTEAVKLLIGKGAGGYLTAFDIWKQEFKRIKIDRRQDCPTCSKKEFKFLEEGLKSWCRVFCGRNSVQINPKRNDELDLDKLSDKMKNLGKLTNHGLFLNFTDSTFDITLFKSGRAIIKGTTDESVAKSVYCRYIGI